MSGGESPRRRGYDFEIKCRDVLTDAGYWVIRTPASRSPIDLVAIKVGQVLAVQCKLAGYLPPAGRESLRGFAKYGMTPILASRGTKRGQVVWRELLPEWLDGAGESLYRNFVLDYAELPGARPPMCSSTFGLYADGEKVEL